MSRTPPHPPPPPPQAAPPFPYREPPPPQAAPPFPYREPPSPPPPPPQLAPPFPYREPVVVSSSNTTTIHRVPRSLRHLKCKDKDPVAVAIGPYHHDPRGFQEMEEAKRAAVDYFCRAANQSREVVYGKILSVAGIALKCYDYYYVTYAEQEEYFANMMLLDGCFLLQFMISMCPDDPDAPVDPLMSRVEVHTRFDAICRDLLLLENQIPWLVLKALMEFRTSEPPVPVDRFLALMAAAFDVGNDAKPTVGGEPTHEPPHLLALFHHRQVGRARTENHHVPNLSSLSSTAVELAEMGVKLTASKGRKFGEVTMTKRRRLLYGELSLAPVVLSNLTACWLYNMPAYEACLGAAQADNFAVSSYIRLTALLVNREEDVQELRAKGIINSEFSNKETLDFFKELASHLRVGHRYYQIFESLQEYKQERWMWIAIHKFLYKHLKAIITVLSVIGVLAGLFKTLVSLKQPQRQPPP